MKRILVLTTLAAALTAAQPSTASDSAAVSTDPCAGVSFCDPSSCGPCTGPCPAPCAPDAAVR